MVRLLLQRLPDCLGKFFKVEVLPSFSGDRFDEELGEGILPGLSIVDLLKFEGEAVLVEVDLHYIRNLDRNEENDKEKTS